MRVPSAHACLLLIIRPGTTKQATASHHSRPAFQTHAASPEGPGQVVRLQLLHKAGGLLGCPHHAEMDRPHGEGGLGGGISGDGGLGEGVPSPVPRHPSAYMSARWRFELGALGCLPKGSPPPPPSSPAWPPPAAWTSQAGAPGTRSRPRGRAGSWRSGSPGEWQGGH